ncbi:N-acetylmuramoyl-L-alanine amidase [Virgibacillus oceani]
MQRKLRVGILLIAFSLFCLTPLTITAAENEEPEQESSEKEEVEEGTKQTEEESNEVESEESATQEEPEAKEEEVIDEANDAETGQKENNETEDSNKNQENNETKDEASDDVKNIEDEEREEPQDSIESEDEVSIQAADDDSPLYEEGSRGDHVVELKKNLTKLGIGNYPENPSDFFGDSTKYNVEEFQRYYGLEVTGIADEETLSVLEDNVNSPYKDGESGDHVVELKQNLTTLGIGNYPSSPSNYFGDSTENNVKAFQRSHGLKENGIADDVTLAIIDEQLELLHEPPYGEGSRGDHVVELKKNLTKLGIGNYPDNPSDFFGDSTKYNVEKFQRYYGLEVTGVADEETLSVLDANVNSPYQDGERGDHIVELKQNLTTMGIGNYPSSPSNYFGDSTENNVKEFQRLHDLKENGIADDVTLAKIEELLELGEGARGQHVVELKKNLTKLGIGNYPDNPSNFFGDSTRYNVEEFQRYYGLEITGIADEETLSVLEANVNSPYQDGERGDHIVELKQNLTAVGIGNYPTNPSNYFGDSTAYNVSEFQRYYGLKVNGIADDVTIVKLQEVLDSSYKDGERGEHVVELKKNLTRLGIGNYPENPSNYFGDSTKYNVEAFQRYYGINVNGIADEVTLEKIQEILNSPYQDGERGTHVVELKKKLTKLDIGNYPTNPSNYFGDSTEYNVKEFQRSYGLNINGIADEVTLRELDKAIQNNVVKIFLDPGHGGNDPGGQGYGLDEKDVVLDIALKTADVLLSSYTGVDVQLSRTDDTFVELEDRANQANEWGADYFVSFHVNAFMGLAEGFETYIHNGNVSSETRERQEDIHDYLIDRIDVNDRGKKDANFSVLRNTSMPAILLEYMFIDNYDENQKLSDSSYRDFLGRITAEAIAHSFGLNN